MKPLQWLALLLILSLAGCAGQAPAVDREPGSHPVWSGWIEVRGIRVHYLDTDPAGSQEVMLILHGFLGSTVPYLSFVEKLREQGRVLMPDLPGSGLTAPPTTALSLEYYEVFLREFTARLSLERVVLIANSMGCQIAAHYASVNPLQVRAVVLSCPFGLEGQASGRARLGRNEALLRLLAPWISRARLRRELAKAAVDASLISPRILDSYWASLRTAAGRRVASQQLARIAFRVPLEPMLPGIRQPLLILLGELDPLCWPEHAGQLKSLSPGAQVLRLHGLGHLPFLQDPQEMHRQISFFLSSRTLGASEARGALPLLPHPNNYP